MTCQICPLPEAEISIEQWETHHSLVDLLKLQSLTLHSYNMTLLIGGISTRDSSC
jgi:hypothetical protein